jgi:hypothetical protein
VRVRLVGEGAGSREMRFEGLGGGTQIAEVRDLLLAAEELGVLARAVMSLRLDARVLRGEETLAEAGVVAGGEVELCLGEKGGKPGFVHRLRQLLGGSRAAMSMLEPEEDRAVLGALDVLRVPGLVSVVDLTAQQQRAAAAPVFPATAEVMLLIACHAPVSDALPATHVFSTRSS